MYVDLSRARGCLLGQLAGDALGGAAEHALDADQTRRVPPRINIGRLRQCRRIEAIRWDGERRPFPLPCAGGRWPKGRP